MAQTDLSPESTAERELLTVNMGPQHPSTHGVLRLELMLDGEVVVHCRPVIGYLHTGIEKTFEAKTYVQGVVLTDRMDYLNPLGNNLAYALSIEKLLGCEIPAARDRAARAAGRADPPGLAPDVHRLDGARPGRQLAVPVLLGASAKRSSTSSRA